MSQDQPLLPDDEVLRNVLSQMALAAPCELSPSGIKEHTRKCMQSSRKGASAEPSRGRKDPNAYAVNSNILPTRRSPIERRLARLRARRLRAICRTAREASAVEHTGAIVPEKSQNEDSCCYNNTPREATKRTYVALRNMIERQAREKPVFVISTRNKLGVNARCFLGRLISDLQKRRPQSLYRINRAKESSEGLRFPTIARSYGSRSGAQTEKGGGGGSSNVTAHNETASRSASKCKTPGMELRRLLARDQTDNTLTIMRNARTIGMLATKGPEKSADIRTRRLKVTLKIRGLLGAAPVGS